MMVIMMMVMMMMVMMMIMTILCSLVERPDAERAAHYFAFIEAS
jgi:hypothetical protein